MFGGVAFISPDCFRDKHHHSTPPPARCVHVPLNIYMCCDVSVDVLWLAQLAHGRLHFQSSTLPQTCPQQLVESFVPVLEICLLFRCSGKSSGRANVERWLELVPFGPALQTPSAKDNSSGAPWMGCFLLLTSQQWMAQKTDQGQILEKIGSPKGTPNTTYTTTNRKMDSKLLTKWAQQLPIKGWNSSWAQTLGIKTNACGTK